MMPRRPSTPMIVVGVLSALLFTLGGSNQAQASFTSAPTASQSISTATLAAPTGVTLSATCGLVVATTPYMTASWTATTSTFATGYKITPYLNGTAQSVVTVTGQATTTTNVNITRSTSLGSNNMVWTFTIAAAFNSSWTSTSVSPSPATVACPFL